jgi:type I restriction enzyme S subunit
LTRSFFKPEYLEIEEKLGKIKSQNLENYCFFIKKGIFDISPIKYKKSGIPFLRVSNIKNQFIDENDLVYIDEETNLENNKTELNYGDIVLSKVGTLGDAVINLKFDKVNFSQNNIGIKIDQEKINPLFAISFFNSKYGKKQIEKQQSGQIQQKLVLDDVKYLKIPILP